MRKTYFTVSLFAILILIAPVAYSQESATDSTQPFEGIWQGSLELGATQLRIVFHIHQDDSGVWTASMDSPDQGAEGIAVDQVEIKGDSLFLTIAVAQGSYNGVLEEGIIKGHWNQSGMSLALDLERVEQVEIVSRPQDPVEPFPYLAEEVTVENETAGITLAGTLTLPKTGAHFAAVILITGSGPQDRNETVANHRPFLVLADHLTRQGIAVLRMDDRGMGESGGDFSTATTMDFASDILAGVTFLKSRPDISKDRIGLAGHSEGGLVAPIVATQSEDIAFIVLLAGPGMIGEDLLVLQGKLINETAGMMPDQVQANTELQKKMFTLLKNEKDDGVLEEKLGEVLVEFINSSSPQQVTVDDPTVQMQVRNMVAPWFRYFMTLDPIQFLEKVTCPVLAINGELDLQVPPKQNLASIEEALIKGGNKNYTIKELPGLNHLFQTATTGLMNEYAQIEETFSPAAMEIISQWILARTEGK
jgi:fermentation-respiration switch protein FrsA (DUF1100 family)